MAETLDPEVHTGRADVAATEAVDEVAREWVLAGRADDRFALGSVVQTDRSELDVGAVKPRQTTLTRRLEVARPLGVAVRVAQVHALTNA